MQTVHGLEDACEAFSLPKVMMIMRRFALITCAGVMVLLFSGCPKPGVGKCVYSEDPTMKFQVTISKIYQSGEGESAVMVVEVTGDIEDAVALSPEDYEQCLASKGYRPGSSVTVTGVSGGPCPGKLRIAQCPY